MDFLGQSDIDCPWQSNVSKSVFFLLLPAIRIYCPLAHTLSSYLLPYFLCNNRHVSFFHFSMLYIYRVLISNYGLDFKGDQVVILVFMVTKVWRILSRSNSAS